MEEDTDMAKDYFLKTENNTKLSTADLEEPKLSNYNEYFCPLAAELTRIYFGWDHGKPLVWRVLKNGCHDFNGDKYVGRNTLLIDCDTVISMGPYDSKKKGGELSRWRNCWLKNYLNGEFLSDNTKVKKFIAPSYKRESSNWLCKHDSFEPLEDEKFFVLDYSEIEDNSYYKPHNDILTSHRQACQKKYKGDLTDYWLRSHRGDDIADYAHFN